ncbi:hypothetical protein ACLOJK_034685 [Asimina triloba]
MPAAVGRMMVRCGWKELADVGDGDGGATVHAVDWMDWADRRADMERGVATEIWMGNGSSAVEDLGGCRRTAGGGVWPSSCDEGCWLAGRRWWTRDSAGWRSVGGDEDPAMEADSWLPLDLLC